MDNDTSFLGRGWSFPPEFDRASRGVKMTTDEEDIRASLMVLFGTSEGERLFVPEYGLNLRDMLFESLSTTTRTLLEDRIRINLLKYEPRIDVIALQLESFELEGMLRVVLEYSVKATNSRFNLVIPFNTTG